MRRLHVRHATIYRYAKLVRFAEHRLVVRPHDSHDLRVLDTRLGLSLPGPVRWRHDVFGNSIALYVPEGQADRLELVSDVLVEHHGIAATTVPPETYAKTLPFAYDQLEVPDLGRTSERHYPDPDHVVDAWARRFLGSTSSTLDVLVAMTRAIPNELRYEVREAEGTQTPVETLARGAGACRDFTLLLMEAARSLGMAARFVSGYLAGAPGDMVGTGATHAWAAIYVPGPGWIELDPTNGLVGGDRLIRVAVAREPSQVVPVAGSYVGGPGDAIGMEVTVDVTELPADAPSQLPS